MKTILVVEDDRALLTLLAVTLRQRGYAVCTAVDGEALREAVRERPDLILLDMAMPEMDGVAVGRWLRQQEETRTIPIVAMSASSDLIERAQTIPADATLAKPLDLDVVVDCVKELTGGET